MYDGDVSVGMLDGLARCSTTLSSLYAVHFGCCKRHLALTIVFPFRRTLPWDVEHWSNVVGRNELAGRGKGRNT